MYLAYKLSYTTVVFNLVVNYHMIIIAPTQLVLQKCAVFE